MEFKIQQMGNSLGIIIPKDEMKIGDICHLNWTPNNDEISYSCKNQCRTVYSRYR